MGVLNENKCNRNDRALDIIKQNLDKINWNRLSCNWNDNLYSYANKYVLK